MTPAALQGKLSFPPNRCKKEGETAVNQAQFVITALRRYYQVKTYVGVEGL